VKASQCSNTRIAATHTRPWSNIRARIGRLCARVRGLILTPKRASIFTKNASRSAHDATTHYTNDLQPCRSHLITSTVWNRHMRRPEVQSRRYRHGARQWFWDTCTSRMCACANKSTCAQPTSVAAGAASMQPSLAWLVRQLEREISSSWEAHTCQQTRTVSYSIRLIRAHCGQRGRWR
jgi:hypothetical protein